MPTVFNALIKLIRDLPFRSTPLDSDMIPCAGEDGNTYRTTRGAIRQDIALPAGHAASHKHGGLDEVATATPAPNAIVKADGSGKVDGWVSSATTSTPGLAQLAVNGQSNSGVVVQGNDSRLGTIFVLPTIGGSQTASTLATDDTTGIGLSYGGGTATIFLGEATESALGGVILATPSSDTTSGHVVQANDARLSDARTPTAHTHSGADITSGTVAAARLPDATTSTKGIVELATNGESASGVVVQGNDERLLKIIRKSTLTSVSGSSAVTADPELTRSVVAGSTYYFRLVIHVDDAGATGITYSLDGTATYSHIRYQTYAVGNVSWGLLNADRVTGIGITSQAVGDTFYCVYIDGSCVVTGSGTMEFNWGPSSVVIDDVSVLEGSTFELTLAMA